ncbi:hypothetical protein [Methylobacterium nodulans]|uniref:Uncharacterized protein n=1 Tax=Methylobacterium nodulans (strain LMG 21967 / CNCM I-2342 / ORS 2060) TaxID=460265 RepID=B8INW5_METNO|nr:hypothetical protein [Methylobacterium nodulans]ACL58481.1 hypothetical protein Mnod_3572 [Methylobacterium nodulans ORS 2060]
MTGPARLRPLQVDPLSDAFAAAYEAGATVGQVAALHQVSKGRVARALRRRCGVRLRTRSEASVLGNANSSWTRIRTEQAHDQLAALRAANQGKPERIAACLARAIHALRARVRIAGPMPADARRIAAAHAAGLTLDDIAMVFGVGPVEAVAAIAAQRGR